VVTGAVYDGSSSFGQTNQYLQQKGNTVQWVTPIGMFNDRGDPKAADYAIGDFTVDNTWRDLDLSSLVPAGARAVLLRVDIRDAATSKVFAIREKGNGEAINIAQFSTQVANITVAGDLIAICDQDRVVQYKISAGMDISNVTVGGWW